MQKFSRLITEVTRIFDLPENDLLRAALQHESALSKTEAEARYGTHQNELALQGDARLRGYIVDYVCAHKLEPQAKQYFEANASLELWAKALGLLDLFEIKRTKKTKVTHAAGTFMEAIIELMYRHHGPEFTGMFLRYNYFVTLEQLSGSHQVEPPACVGCVSTPPAPVTCAQADHTVNPVIDYPALNSLRERINALYGRKLTLIRKCHPRKGSAYRISFHYGHGSHAKPVTFEANYASGSRALQKVCDQALSFLSRTQAQEA